MSEPNATNEPNGVRTEPSVTLHSSWIGIVSSMLGLAILIFFAGALLVANGLTAVSGIVAVAAIGAAVVMLFDMPIATRFEGGVIERLTPLRRRRVSLDTYDRFGRMRRAFRRPGSGASSTGLVAMRGRRQTLLVDRMEGHLEHQMLRSVLGEFDADRLLHDVLPPPLNRTPTWVGRRRRWRPEGASWPER